MINYYSKKEYQSIADMYGIGKIKKLSNLYRGFGGSAKVLAETALGKYIISKNILSNREDIISKSKESLQYEIDMLNFIKGLPVPAYHASLKGNYIEKLNDGWVTVYDYIQGEPPKKITPAMAFELGKFLGEFHSQGKEFKRELKSRRKFYDLNPGVMKKMEPIAVKQKNSKLKSVFEEIKIGVEKYRPDLNFPSGPIHVDIWKTNELFQKDKLSGIIDFGNFYIGPLMVDVGKTIMWNCCPNKKLDKKLFEKFIKGYENKRKFSKMEKAYLKKSILYAIYSHIWVDLYHVPLKYVPVSWPLFLIESFLPVARELEKYNL